MRHALTVWLLLVVACGDDAPSDAGDASIDGDGGTDGSIPPIAAPAAPMLGPCPPGWRESTGDEGIDVCEPFAADGPAECGDTEVDLPGGGGCAPLDACPASDFSETLPTDVPILYVRPGAVAGDGTESSPYGSISEALLRVDAGEVIALAKGSYDSLIRLPAGVTLHGACAAETILTTTITLTPVGLVDVAGPGSAVRHLSIEGIDRTGISVNTEGTLEIEDVRIHDVAGVGVYVLGGSITADGLMIDGVRSTSDGRFGRGIDVNAGGSFEGARVSVRRVHDVGVRSDGGNVTLSDFVIDEIAADLATRTTGSGMQVFGDVAVTLGRGYVGHVRQEGIFSTGATLFAEQLVIRHVLGRESDGNVGVGLIATAGTRATLRRVLVDRTTSAGLAADVAPTTMSLEDVVIRDVQPNPMGDLGWGMDVSMGATATASRVEVLRAQGVGIAARGAGARIDATDVAIDDTLANPYTDAGLGLNVVTGAAFHGERVRIRGANDLGVFGMNEGTEVTLSDLEVSDVESRSIDGRYGRGIDIELGATLTLERAAIRRVRNLGLFVGNRDASATLTDVTIEGVRYERCADDMTCPMDPAAAGLGAYNGARIDATRFVVDDVALCGVQVGPNGELDLVRGEVTGCEIGACVYVSDYDIDRLTRDVRYGGNGTNLVVSGALPLPVPAPRE